MCAEYEDVGANVGLEINLDVTIFNQFSNIFGLFDRNCFSISNV